MSTQLDTTVADAIISRFAGGEAPTLTAEERELFNVILGVAKVLKAYNGSLEPVLKFAADRYPKITGDETKAELVEKATRAGASTDGTEAELSARLLALSG